MKVQGEFGTTPWSRKTNNFPAAPLFGSLVHHVGFPWEPQSQRIQIWWYDCVIESYFKWLRWGNQTTISSIIKMMIIIGTDLNNKIMWIYLVLIASEKRWYFYKTFGLHHCLTKLFSWISWWASSRRFASFWEARCFSWRKARNGESEMKFSGQCQATGLDAIHVPCLTLWDMSDILSHIST